MEAQVVALFSYEDFIGEITGVVHEVRVQDYYRVRANGSAEWTDYYVELSAERVYPPFGIYVRRFRVGGNPVFDEDRHARNAENARKAVEALRQDLERRRFGVRPGVFVAAKEADVLAAPPWHFEQDEQKLPVLVLDLE